uniref:Putative ovule protein n=1 Tax=Solanum chacoense TaxID=4108 RepID=A0A0V0H953_SOLCH
MVHSVVSTTKVNKIFHRDKPLHSRCKVQGMKQPKISQIVPQTTATHAMKHAKNGTNALYRNILQHI